ncbi:MAG: enoyl-CoA hydratase/isomerase family protein [Burkholderiales bacterium]|nr:enoyl-CoA hydratase/isomerase family protein [Burkholderiales bacterium]
MAVEVSIAGSVATLVLNRPEALNALDPQTVVELTEAVDRVNQNSAVRVIILTGSGTRAFCAGADLKKTMPGSATAADTDAPRAMSYREAMTAGKPIVCAINGYALGGGLELALACDIRIAASSARFGLPEVRIGSIPGGGGTQRLPRAIGASDAMLLLLTGDHIDAAEALRIGLISRVVPAPELMEHAQSIATRIAANGPLAVRAVKRLVHHGASLPLDAAIAAEQDAFRELLHSRDRIEGRLAFAEKRAPVFQGH